MPRSLIRTAYVFGPSAIMMILLITIFSVSADNGVGSDEAGAVAVFNISTRAVPEESFDYEYIAIGKSSFHETIKPLLEWKTRKGVKAGYFNLDGPGGILNASNNQFKGRDDQETVRNFIFYIWNNTVLYNKTISSPPYYRWVPILKWVILAGDGEIIPMRKTYAGGEWSEDDEDEDYVYSDMYYAGLTGNWDKNGNDVFGEEGDLVEDEADWEADVFVGRFPASNNKELKIMVDRQLEYEKNPPSGEWTRSMLLTGSAMDSPNSKIEWDPYKDNAYELVQRVEGNLPDHVMPYHLVDYPEKEYGGYNQMFDTLNRSSFESYYETGFSTALLACHGDQNGNCTDYKGDSGGIAPWYVDMDIFFDYEQAETIDNGDRNPLVYISNCDSLNFSEDDDTNMERLMRNQYGGAIGLIGASVTTYRGEYPEEIENKSSFGNWWLAEEFFRILYNETPHPGEALYTQKWNHLRHIYDGYSPHPYELRMFRIDNLAYNLLGDPEGPIWLDTPRRMDVTMPEEYIIDSGVLRVNVRDTLSGNPIHDARVAISHDDIDRLYNVTETNFYGNASIHLDLDELQELNVVITNNGYLPIERRIKIVSNTNVGIKTEVNMTPEIPIYGKPLEIKYTIKNTGSRDLKRDVSFRTKISSGNQSMNNPDEQIVFTLNASREKEISLSYNTPYPGINTIEAVVSILSGTIESNISDNRIVFQFRANDPVSILPINPQKTDEDTPLSVKSGLLNISYYINDMDSYPKPATPLIGDINGHFTIERHHIGDFWYLDIIPDQDWFGENDYYFELFVSDGSTTDNKRIYVQVNPVNDAPEFIEQPSLIDAVEDELTYFDVLISDVDSDEVDLNISLDDAQIIRSQTLDGFLFNISFTPDESMVGSDTILINATDGDGGYTRIERPLKVASSNDPPFVRLPFNSVNITKGRGKQIELDIEDPDLDQKFSIKVESAPRLFDTFWVNDSSVVNLRIPRNADVGEYAVTFTVMDSNEDATEITMTLYVLEDETSIFNPLVILIGTLGIITIISYMVFTRIQEKRHKNMLEDVGVTTPLEARPLSEYDFKEEGPEPPSKDSLPMPPSPVEVEAALAREERELEEEEEELEIIDGERDFESDLDDVLSEFFPNQ
ncbi:MAG: C25 family cysteine peptidase [Thermoplasmatota archaeon]